MLISREMLLVQWRKHQPKPLCKKHLNLRIKLDEVKAPCDIDTVFVHGPRSIRANAG